MKKYSNIPDEQLMRRLQRGDQQAFNEIYARYSRRILYYFYKMLRQDEAKAQDLMQNVFLKIVEAPEKFNTQQSFKTWIFTVAANGCKNYFRDQQRQQAHIEQYVQQQDQQESPEDLLPAAVIRQHIHQAIDTLAPHYKEPFLLKYKEGLRLQEIAQVMDCPLGTVKSRLNGACKKLAQHLKPLKNQLLND